MNTIAILRDSANYLFFHRVTGAVNPLTPIIDTPHLSTIDKVKMFCYSWFAALSDVVPNVVTKIIPNGIRWLYRTMYTGEITRHSISATIGGETKNACLYFHGVPKKGWDTQMSAVLLIPGDDSPAYSLLHLADIAQKTGNNVVFSLCIPKPADDTHPLIDQLLVTLAIDQIQRIIGEHRVGGNRTALSHLDMIGHSRGGIQSAYQMFVLQDPRVSRAFVIGARVRFVDSLMKPCEVGLIPAMNELEKAIPSTRDNRFMQVIGVNDWAVPTEAIAKDQPKVILKDASHLGAAYHRRTLAELSRFLR